MVKKVLILSVVCIMSAVCAVHGEEVFGIPVYPGAKQDAATAKQCEGMPRTKCYRTSDDFSKVVAFYEKQPNLEHTKFYATMPQSMKDDQRKGPKKVFELCLKGAGDMCGFAELPTVRINSPWTTKRNISPAAPLSGYEGKDVFFMITDTRKK